MSNNPADSSPITDFPPATKGASSAPDQATLLAAGPSGFFKLALYHQGLRLGWLGQNNSEWAILVANENQALTLENYPYNNVTYYRVKGSDRYMSVSKNAYIGFYGWLYASGFTLSDGHLVSDYNKQKLSLYSKDNGYLYAWDGQDYTVLKVKFEAA
ncbi:MAG: hypothetical protein V4673_17265 [Pseudomonadota bacterium]